MSYTLHKEYRFTVCDEEFAILWHKTERMWVEETRKNGQEDCHMSGELAKRDGLWAWSDDSMRKSFDRYGNDGVADAIPAYLNANPLPEEF
jgi:hypothetical protein